MGSAENIETEIIAAVRKGALLEDKKITMDSTLEDLEIDSLDITNISFEIEDELGVVLEQDDMEHIKSVGDLAALIRERLAESGSSS